MFPCTKIWLNSCQIPEGRPACAASHLAFLLRLGGRPDGSAQGRSRLLAFRLGRREPPCAGVYAFSRFFAAAKYGADHFRLFGSEAIIYGFFTKPWDCPMRPRPAAKPSRTLPTPLLLRRRRGGVSRGRKRRHRFASPAVKREILLYFSPQWRYNFRGLLSYCCTL